MTKRELNTIRNAVNMITKNFVWCENYATNEIKQVFKILDCFNLNYTCIEDDYLWIGGEPTTKNQTYRIETAEGEVLETVLIVSRYYGSDFNNNGHCELNAYMA